MKVYLAIDQGTTGTTSVIINAETFELIDKVNKEFPQIYPSPGLVEHNLNDIWNTCEATIKNVLEKNNVDPDEIIAIGITNQRETTCAFDKDGRPLTNAIVWQDRRTNDFCEELKLNKKAQEITTKTGLPVDPYFSATKMKWMLENVKKVKDAHEQKNLLFGTIDTFLLYKLSGNIEHKTEASNASRTLLMSLKNGQWDDELLDTFHIPKSTLPVICDSFGIFGKTKGLSFLPDGIPISGILGDQQSALFGQAGLKSGDIKCTYGTGAFMLLNTGEEPIVSQNGLITTVAYRANGKQFYALEGAAYIAGAAVQWIRDNLSFIDSSPKVEGLASEVTNLKEMKNLIFFPFFTGLGTPYWISQAKASIIGLTRDTSKKHLALACLDGINLSINDLYQSMVIDSKLTINAMNVDGGAAANNLLMENQATCSQMKIIRPKVIETTAYGAALAAAIGVDKLRIDEISTLWQQDREFLPNEKKKDYYDMKKGQWKDWIQKIYL
ncbi:MAG: glycerol kinase GlpK [Halobacteriovoraceae bacterium]|nr:glycerol kinase GlpK [Halobacteriovoraceae bacterium]